MLEDEIYMRRCLELAHLGLGKVAPNPMVGAVIVHNHTIIGEGYHRQFGGAHAEVNAIKSVADKALLQEATLYVNLEPCSHFGKTPPCTDLIIQHGLSKVVIATTDPNPPISGQGIKALMQGSCQVKLGILEQEARELNHRFFTFHQKKRPYIILKWAQTKDKFIGQKGAYKLRISNEYSQKLVHKWRGEEQAIMVGTTTALLDNPQLDTRLWEGKNPIRIVLDKDLKLPGELHLLDKNIPTIVFTAHSTKSFKNLEYITIDFSQNVLHQIFRELYARQIQSVIVEGGQQLLNSCIENGDWDEARIFMTDSLLFEGIPAPEINGTVITEEYITGDRLLISRNPS